MEMALVSISSSAPAEKFGFGAVSSLAPAKSLILVSYHRQRFVAMLLHELYSVAFNI